MKLDDAESIQLRFKSGCNAYKEAINEYHLPTRKKKFEDARIIFNQILQSLFIAEVAFKACLCLYQQEKYHEVITSCDNIITQDPNYQQIRQVHYYKARSYENLSEFIWAIENYDMVINDSQTKDTTYYDALYKKSILLYRMGELEKSLACFKNVNTLDATKNLFEGAPGYYRMHLRHFPNYPHPDLGILNAVYFVNELNQRPYIKELCAPNTGTIDFLKVVVENSRYLTTFESVFVEETGAEALAKCTQLRDLTLECLNDDVLRLVATNKNLTRLEVNHAHGDLTDASIDCVATSFNLKELSLSYLKLTNLAAQKISNLSELRVLNLSGNSIDDKGACYFLNHPNLLFLDIECCNVSDGLITRLQERLKINQDAMQRYKKGILCLFILLCCESYLRNKKNYSVDILSSFTRMPLDILKIIFSHLDPVYIGKNVKSFDGILSFLFNNQVEIYEKIKAGHAIRISEQIVYDTEEANTPNVQPGFASRRIYKHTKFCFFESRKRKIESVANKENCVLQSLEYKG